VKKEGWYGDGARTFPVGRINEEKSRLLEVTEEALQAGIVQARSGNRLHDVSAAVQKHVEAAGFSVVRDLVGHGIGKHLHEDPAVPNFGVAGTGVLLREGMTLAIEPMVNAGTFVVRLDDDGWTVLTTDGRPSAHFEHTVAITQGEAEILTKHGLSRAHKSRWCDHRDVAERNVQSEPGRRSHDSCSYIGQDADELYQDPGW